MEPNSITPNNNNNFLNPFPRKDHPDKPIPVRKRREQEITLKKRKDIVEPPKKYDII